MRIRVQLIRRGAGALRACGAGVSGGGDHLLPGLEIPDWVLQSNRRNRGVAKSGVRRRAYHKSTALRSGLGVLSFLSAIALIATIILKPLYDSPKILPIGSFP